MDAVDNADELIEKQKELELQKIQDKLISNDAVECIDCSMEIPPARKKAVPSAKRCIECEELWELKK